MPPKVKKTYTPPANLKTFRQAQEKKYATQLVRQKEKVVLEFIPTGVSSLDVALGGGWARGRYHQIIGQANNCKTAMMLIAMREALETYPDLGVSYIDIENTVTEERFLSHGVDPDDPRFFWRKPNSADPAPTVEMWTATSPCSVNFTALPIRFNSTCRKRSESPRTRAGTSAAIR